MKICPVCNRKADTNDITCPLCKASFALVTDFASKSGYERWKKQMENRSRERVSSLVESFSNHQLSVDSNYISFRGNKEGSLTVLKGNGSTVKYENALQYSKSTRHTVILMNDGTVRAEGDQTDGKCNVADLKDVVCVYADANATYAVSCDGDVSVRGISPVATQVSAWKSVQKLTGNRGRIAAVTKSGEVLIADDTKKVTANATQATDVVTTFNFTVWLNRDGTVGYSGKDNDARATGLSQWKDIVAVAVDNYCVAGLTSDGRVLTAGKVVEAFDMGHSDMSQWRNVIALTGFISGFMGIFSDGSVKIAGNVDNKDSVSRDAEETLASYI